MIRVVKPGNRHFSDFGWLKTYWLFSFSDYYDPDNIQFGALRVFNDDVVMPGEGFPTHPHREMEIVTIPLEGEMTHADSMGNQAVIRAGDAQRMSAGTGLTHSEFNLADKPVHFLQIWIYPDIENLSPTYDQRSYDPEAWRNTLFPVASGQGLPDVVTFNTDATIYRSRLDQGVGLSFNQGKTRRVFVYVHDGEVTLNGIALPKGTQARVDEEQQLEIKAEADSGLVLIDVPSCKGFGYDQKTLKGAKA